jgi:hypothetical protein
MKTLRRHECRRGTPGGVRHKAFTHVHHVDSAGTSIETSLDAARTSAYATSLTRYFFIVSRDPDWVDWLEIVATIG